MNGQTLSMIAFSHSVLSRALVSLIETSLPFAPIGEKVASLVLLHSELVLFLRGVPSPRRLHGPVSVAAFNTPSFFTPRWGNVAAPSWFVLEIGSVSPWGKEETTKARTRPRRGVDKHSSPRSASIAEEEAGTNPFLLSRFWPHRSLLTE